eukprot:scaffold130953_cov32-Tisochrysis_lutea.AAC.1
MNGSCSSAAAGLPSSSRGGRLSEDSLTAAVTRGRWTVAESETAEGEGRFIVLHRVLLYAKAARSSVASEEDI